ncbi:hypothetical protein GCM10027073_27210 [Streptomyces chlorus]
MAYEMPDIAYLARGQITGRIRTRIPGRSAPARNPVRPRSRPQRVAVDHPGRNDPGGREQGRPPVNRERVGRAWQTDRVSGGVGEMWRE